MCLSDRAVDIDDVQWRRSSRSRVGMMPRPENRDPVARVASCLGWKRKRAMERVTSGISYALLTDGNGSNEAGSR